MADEKMTERREVEAVHGDKEAHQDTMAQIEKEVTELSGISEKKLLLKTDLHVVPILFGKS